MDISSLSRRHTLHDTYDAYQNVTLKSIKKQKIKDIIKNPEYNKLSKNQCHNKLSPLSYKDTSKICECLNEKNGDMTVEELEIATKNREETPGSSCILLYDKIKRDSKRQTKKHTKNHKNHTNNNSNNHTKNK